MTIAGASGFAALSFGIWGPFMPLYVLELGATSDADALFWVAVASTAQGIARLATSPFWGMLSDRIGRKLIFLRSLFMASTTAIVLAFVTEPWQITIALIIQGAFSGFIPAGVALMSVSVPDHRLGPSLSAITGAQYLSSTIGPALGALMAVFFGFRATILLASILPAISGLIVLFTVPRDEIAPRVKEGGSMQGIEPFRWTKQFALALFLIFVAFGTGQLIRTAAPASLKQLTGGSDVETLLGIAFTLSGIGSVIAIIIGSQHFFQPGRFRMALAITCAVSALAYLLIAGANSVLIYFVGFVIVTMLQSAMIPAVNTLIAGNVSRARRGTGFGLAASAQALAIAAGPLAAAAFAATSLSGGFLATGVFMAATVALILVGLKEPQPAKEQAAPAKQPTG